MRGVALLFILVAATLLVAGLSGGSNALLVGSIAVSVLVAVATIAGARHRTVAATGGADKRTHGDAPGAGPGDRRGHGARLGPPPQRVPGDGPDAGYEPSGAGWDGGQPGVDRVADGGGALSGEPPEQCMPEADRARLSRLQAEVLVLDGRPRYHLSGCAQLLAGDSEAIPVAEALELGFTPCSACEPNQRLLPDAGS